MVRNALKFLYKVQIIGGKSATLKMEKADSSVTLVLKFQITRRQKPEDRNSDSRVRYNLKSNKEN